MESKAKVFGHAIHPILIVFPLGLFATAAIFDAVYLYTAGLPWGTVSYWMIAAGIIGGLLAAVFGFIDYLAIPSGTRAKSIGIVHGLGNVVVVGLFAVSWFLRSDAPATPTGIEMGISYAAVLIAVFTGWLGGELVERLGVGIDDGAHLNAPSSLTSRSAAHSDKRKPSLA